MVCLLIDFGNAHHDFSRLAGIVPAVLPPFSQAGKENILREKEASILDTQQKTQSKARFFFDFCFPRDFLSIAYAPAFQRE